MPPPPSRRRGFKVRTMSTFIKPMTTEEPPRLPLLKSICEFFESGLGSSRPAELSHREGGKVGGVHFLDHRKLTYCYPKEKKKSNNRCILWNPWMPTWARLGHAETHTTQGQWGQEVKGKTAKYTGSVSVLGSRSYECRGGKGSRLWIMFPGKIAEEIRWIWLL